MRARFDLNNVNDSVIFENQIDALKKNGSRFFTTVNPAANEDRYSFEKVAKQSLFLGGKKGIKHAAYQGFRCEDVFRPE